MRCEERDARQPVSAITPLAVGRQALHVDPGLAAVEALEEAGRGQLDEVAVAGIGFSEQRQVVALGASAGVTVVDEVDLAAHDRLDPVLLAGLEELDGAVHDAVIGQSEGRLAEGRGALGEGVDLARAVEQRVLGMDVQMCASGGAHRASDGRDRAGCRGALAGPAAQDLRYLRKRFGILSGVPRSLAPRAACVLCAAAASFISAAPAAAITQPQATRLISVGPGAVEDSVRQIIRTDDGRVYIAAADDEGLPNGMTAHMRMYLGSPVGSPTSFTEQDAAGAPVLTRGNTFHNTFSGGDASLDAAGLIHVSYFRTDDAAAVHQTFSTVTNTWGPATEVMFTVTDNDRFFGDRGRQLTASALGPGDVPFVALSGGSGTNAVRVWHPDSNGNPVIETVELADDGFQRWHPTVAFDRVGRLHLAWLDSPSVAGPPDRIRYAVRSTAGTWSTPQDVSSVDVLGASSGTVVDQGPSIAVDRSDRPAVLYLNSSDLVRVRVLDGDGWQLRDPPGNVFSHGPGLGMRGDDMLALLGHDIAIHPAFVYRPASSGTWSPGAVFDPPFGVDPGNYRYDGSGASRFDAVREPACQIVDSVFFDEDSDTRGPGSFKPYLYYAAITLPPVNGVCGTEDTPGGGGDAPPAGGGTRPPDDRVSPRLTQLSLTRARFRAGDTRARSSFILSEPATVTFQIDRRVGSARHRRWSRVGTYTALRNAGRASALVRSVLNGRRLAPGTCRLRAQARDAAGNRSGLVTRGFVVSP